jgi:putative aminopeptidase FrvX
MNLDLLKKLCAIHSPSGDEGAMKEFLLSYIQKNKAKWLVRPEIVSDNSIQDCLMLVFGKPRTAVFVHMDTIGFMVRYQNQMVPVGSPEVDEDTVLVGTDTKGFIQTKLHVDKDRRVFYTLMRGIDTGTYLVYKPDFLRSGDLIISPCLDNRIGIWMALNLMSVVSDGLIIFTCGEENGGGKTGYLTRLMYNDYQVNKALIADVTWASDGVKSGEGVVISMKDRYIPRRSFIRNILHIAQKNQCKFQLEVEDNGSSDGGEIQRSPYPVDWAFIGPAGMNIHSSRESVDLRDVQEMISLYQILLKAL